MILADNPHTAPWIRSLGADMPVEMGVLALKDADGRMVWVEIPCAGFRALTAPDTVERFLRPAERALMRTVRVESA